MKGSQAAGLGMISVNLSIQKLLSVLDHTIQRPVSQLAACSLLKAMVLHSEALVLYSLPGLEEKENGHGIC